MRHLLIALGLWFGLELVFVAILVVVSAIEGRRGTHEADLAAERVLLSHGREHPPAGGQQTARSVSA